MNGEPAMALVDWKLIVALVATGIVAAVSMMGAATPAFYIVPPLLTFVLAYLILFGVDVARQRMGRGY